MIEATDEISETENNWTRNGTWYSLIFDVGSE